MKASQCIENLLYSLLSLFHITESSVTDGSLMATNPLAKHRVSADFVDCVLEVVKNVLGCV